MVEFVVGSSTELSTVLGGSHSKLDIISASTDDKSALSMLAMCTSLEALKTTWGMLTEDEKTLATVTAKKEELKTKLK